MKIAQVFILASTISIVGCLGILGTVSATDSDLTTETSDDEIITYLGVIKNGLPPVVGNVLKELTTTATPKVPPYEGVPIENTQCKSCHAPSDGWDMEALCDVGKIFANDRSRIYKNPTPNFVPQHPFGGQLKTAIATWAGQGCRLK